MRVPRLKAGKTGAVPTRLHICLIQSVLERHLKRLTLKNRVRITSANCKDNMLDLGEKQFGSNKLNYKFN